MNWLRRNRWGLIALGPLLAGVVAVNADELYRANLVRVPRTPIVADGAGAVEYAGAKLRLIQVTQADPGPELVGRDETLDPGLRIWRSVVEVDAPEGSLVGACNIFLEDALGRRYGPSPSELHGAEATTFGCLPVDQEFDLETGFGPKPRPYQSTSYFVLPSDVRPSAVRIVHDLELPRYARLPVG